MLKRTIVTLWTEAGHAFIVVEACYSGRACANSKQVCRIMSELLAFKVPSGGLSRTIATIVCEIGDRS